MLNLFQDIHFQKSKHGMKLISPWVEVDFEADTNVKDLLSSTENYHKPEFQDALKSFRDFSIFYETPRKSLSKDFTYNHIDKLNENEDLVIDRQNPLFSMASIGEDLYDPLTVFQILEKDCLLKTNNLKDNVCVFNELKTLSQNDKKHFEKIIILILNQTYYITKNFSQVVNVDKPHLCSLKEHVEEIYKEEHGHHKLILESLTPLGVQPDENLVFPETRLLIELLSSCVTHSHTGFALLLSQLEGNHYPEKDPLAEIIELSHIPECAIGLNKHFRINKEHNHKTIGYDIVMRMNSYINENEVRQCLKVINQYIDLTKEIDKKIITHIKNFQK